MSPRATLQPPVVVDNAFGGVNGTYETPLKPLRADCYLPDSFSIFATFLFSSLCSLIRIETQRRHSIHDKQRASAPTRCTLAWTRVFSSLSPFNILSSQSLPCVHSRVNGPLFSANFALDHHVEPDTHPEIYDIFLLRSSSKRMTRRVVRNFEKCIKVNVPCFNDVFSVISFSKEIE